MPDPGSHCPCLVVCVLQEVGFYYMHRLFHCPWFYRHIHRVHHEVRHTIFTLLKGAAEGMSRSSTRSNFDSSLSAAVLVSVRPLCCISMAPQLPPPHFITSSIGPPLHLLLACCSMSHLPLLVSPLRCLCCAAACPHRGLCDVCAPTGARHRQPPPRRHGAHLPGTHTRPNTPNLSLEWPRRFRYQAGSNHHDLNSVPVDIAPR